MTLTRRKLLKVLIKSIFEGGWRSTQILHSASDKESDESMSFEIDGKFHSIRLVVYKKEEGQV